MASGICMTAPTPCGMRGLGESIEPWCNPTQLYCCGTSYKHYYLYLICAIPLEKHRLPFFFPLPYVNSFDDVDHEAKYNQCCS